MSPLWSTFFISLFVSCTSDIGDDFPRILVPKERSGKEPLVTLVPIIAGVAVNFRLPCEVGGKSTNITWGKVTEEDPFLLIPTGDSWRPVEDSATNGQSEGVQKIISLEQTPGSTLTADSIRGLYRCRVTYGDIVVNSPVVQLEEAEYSGSRYGEETIARSDENGNVIMPCANSFIQTHMNPQKYLPHYDTSWRLLNRRNQDSDSVDVVPDPMRDGDPYIIEAGGMLLFSSFQQQHIRALEGYDWDDTVIDYECTLTQNRRNPLGFPTVPIGKYKVNWQTIHPRGRGGPIIRPPKLLRWNDGEVVESVAGELTVLYCLYSRGPDGFPEVKWTFTNDAGKDPEGWRKNPKSVRSRNAHVEFVAALDLAGTIRCDIDGENSDSRSFQYVVRDPLTLSSNADMSYKQVTSGSGVEFNCALSTPYSVSWYYNENSLEDSELEYNVEGDMGQILKISNLQPEQSGGLSCSAPSNYAPDFHGSTGFASFDPFKIKINLTNYKSTDNVVELTDVVGKSITLTASYPHPKFVKLKRQWVATQKGETFVVTPDDNQRITIEDSMQGEMAVSKLKFTVSSEADATELGGWYQYKVEAGGLAINSTTIILTPHEQIPYLTILAIVGIALVQLVAICVLAIYCFMRCGKPPQYEIVPYLGEGAEIDVPFNPNSVVTVPQPSGFQMSMSNLHTGLMTGTSMMNVTGLPPGSNMGLLPGGSNMGLLRSGSNMGMLPGASQQGISVPFSPVADRSRSGLDVTGLLNGGLMGSSASKLGPPAGSALKMHGMSSSNAAYVDASESEGAPSL